LKEKKMTNLQITLANLQSEYQRNFEINKSLRVQIQDLKFQVVKEKAFAKVLRQSAKAQKLAAREAKKAARIEALEKKIMALRMR
jgi:Leu/Phe-tRNA-protein transferase